MSECGTPGYSLLPVFFHLVGCPGWPARWNTSTQGREVALAFIFQLLPHLGVDLVTPWPTHLTSLPLLHEGNSCWIYLTFFLPRDSFQSQKHAESMHRAGSQAPVSLEKVRVAVAQVNWQTKASNSLPLVWNTSSLVPHGSRQGWASVAFSSLLLC